MHALAKNFAGQLTKKVEERKVSTEFGETLRFKDIYFAKLDNECLTLEKFIEGKFEKYMNNTGELCVSHDNVIGQKAECFSHFSYEKSNSQLMVADLQGSGHMFFDPEIASATLIDSDNEFLFCAENLTSEAITTFVNAHSCNKFCSLLDLKELESQNSSKSHSTYFMQKWRKLIYKGYQREKLKFSMHSSSLRIPWQYA